MESGGEVPGRSLRRVGLFALAFGSGFAVLTIEIAGARMIAPVFGLSAVPWTAVIGVILAALALGSHLGGRLADRGSVPLAAVLVVAGATAIVPVLGGGVPWVLRDLLGFIPGAVASAAVLFAPPVLCLGAVVPFLLRADVESLGSIGRRAGDLSAAATAGSIAGSFATGFVLLPLLPLPLLMAATAASLFLMAALAGRLLGSAVPRVALVVAAVCSMGLALVVATPADPSVLHEEQTLYGAVRVTEREWRDGRIVRELWQNGGSSSAEYLDDGTPAHLYAKASLEALAPALDKAESVLVLGGAALTLPVAFHRRDPELRIDVVEIDPVVTGLARRYFAAGALPEGALRVIHDDARVYLRTGDERYDVLYLDVFDHLLTVPWTMVTREALTEMSARLRPDGIFAANVLSPLEGPGVAFLAAFRATLEAVFPAVDVLIVDPSSAPRSTQNVLVVAALDPSSLPRTRFAEAGIAGAPAPLTDLWAPVEGLQARVFFQGLGWN